MFLDDVDSLYQRNGYDNEYFFAHIPIKVQILVFMLIQINL